MRRAVFRRHFGGLIGFTRNDRNNSSIVDVLEAFKMLFSECASANKSYACHGLSFSCIFYQAAAAASDGPVGSSTRWPIAVLEHGM